MVCQILFICIFPICVAMGVYYYVVVLPRVLRMHNNANRVLVKYDRRV